MACCPTEKSYGYEEDRFETKVDENFHCSICYNVLKEPRACRNNEHMFCANCITEHLNINSQSCPECNEHLSVDTLRRPRVLNNYLSKLRINCDYASRGCPEFTCVEDLNNHVENCDYAPVFCSNEGCGKEINKHERVHHESVLCQYRIVKCHDCGLIQKDVGTLKENLVKLDGKVETVNEKGQNNHVEMKKVVGNLEQNLIKLDWKMKALQIETKDELGNVKKEVKNVNKNVSKISKDVDEVKVMMSQILARLNMLELLNKLPSATEGMLTTLELLNKLPFATEGMLTTPREDILIAGGHGTLTTEIYSWEKNSWFEVAPLNEKHEGASSFVYKGQLFVVGGVYSKTIEMLDLNDNLPLKWITFTCGLPYPCDDHQTIVYQERIIYTGGYNFSLQAVSNVISELHVSYCMLSCSVTELCLMPGPRQCHGTEIFEDKILILGGRKTTQTSSAMDSVLEFDVKNNECSYMPPLPRAMSNMATVRWRNKVIVLGGQDDKGEALNDVFMYDSKTGELTALPPMQRRRQRSCAVITGNTIVVMGDWGNSCHSVECFTIGDSTWKYLPAMNKVRFNAIAEVLPSRRKYE